MSSVTVEAQDIKKDFVIDRSLCKQLLAPFAAKRKIRALKGVSFRLKSGEILGVVGSNEAGKTTLLRILADLVEPDAGTVRILGQTLGKNSCKVRRQIGYVSSDERSFFWRLTGKENLEFFARLYGLSRSQAGMQTRHILKEFGFESRANQLFRDYSAGMRKKIAIMRALLHRPPVLLLDEVTNSLGSESARAVKSLIREYVSNSKHCAAVWSTHRLEEITQVCDQVMVIENGKASYCGRVSDFRNRGTVRTDYLLKAKNMDGQYDAFWRECSRSMKVDASRNGSVSKFVFSDISDEDFGHIVTMAVKNYGAYIIFAGCLERSPQMVARL